MRRNVLLIDDDKEIRELVGVFLEQAGFLVCAAKDGYDAFEELERNHFDLVIMDIRMPYLNGFQLLDAIRSKENFKELPIIMLTGRSEKSDLLRVQGQVSDYIVKPPKREDLLARIERILGGRPQFEEIAFKEEDTHAHGQIGFHVRLLSVSVNGFVLLSSVPVSKNFLLDSVHVPALVEIGLERSSFRVMDCTNTNRGYELFVSFYGTSPSDQQRVRDSIMSRSFEAKKKIAA